MNNVNVDLELLDTEVKVEVERRQDARPKHEKLRIKSFPDQTRHDHDNVSNSYTEIKTRLLANGSVDGTTWEKLVKAGVYLELAKKKISTFEAWTHINAASQVLCELAEEAEKKKLMRRFIDWEPLLHHQLKKHYSPEMVISYKDLRAQVGENSCSILDSHCNQWHLINEANHLKIKLLNRVTIIIIITLVTSLLIADNIQNCPERDSVGYFNSLIACRSPFIFSIAGIFGGSLSALITAQLRRVTAVSYRTSMRLLVARGVFGGAGAFVVYLLLQTNGLFGAKFTEMFTTDFGFFLLGTFAGFSERFFEKGLHRIAGPSAVASSDGVTSSPEKSSL